MSLILIRHGETALNASRVVQPADTPLSERGRAQAAALGRRFAAVVPPGERPAAILASDLPRAYQTAEAISAATGLPIVTSETLHERNFGDLRGRAYDELGFDHLATDDAPPNGESVAQFEARVASAFEHICAAREKAGGNLLVVSHGLVIRTLLARHGQLDDGVIVPERIENTSVTELEAMAPYRVRLLNCIVHLGDDTRSAAHGLSGF